MLKVVKRWLVACILVVPIIACAQVDTPYEEGEDYVELAKPVATSDTSRIEVVELFWYGCSHCYSLEPLVRKWTSSIPSDVVFLPMPAILNSSWEVHAKAYLAAKSLGIADKTHHALFEALHEQGKVLFTQQALASFYANYGVTEEAFNKAFNSFPVGAQASRIKSAQRGYQVSGVPVIIVNGKYKVSGAMRRGLDGIFGVVDHLIEKERSAQ